MIFVVLFNHSSGDVWNIAARIGLAGDVDLEVLDSKDCLEVFKKFDKVLGNFFFTGCSDVPN